VAMLRAWLALWPLPLGMARKLVSLRIGRCCSVEMLCCQPLIRLRRKPFGAGAHGCRLAPGALSGALSVDSQASTKVPTGKPCQNASSRECLGQLAAADGDGVKQYGAAESYGFSVWLKSPVRWSASRLGTARARWDTNSPS